MSGRADREGRGPRVLYVMGAGRSGSTTLGITLGNCGELFFAGELDNWLPRSGLPQVEDAERLAFWDQVRARLADPEGAEQLYGTESQHLLERSASLMRVHRGPARRRLRRRYRAVAADLYRAVSSASGKPGVVDTSHYPLRARELQRAEGFDLRLLFLVRDPGSVVASFSRRDVSEFRKSPLHANLYLWVTHLLCLLVFLRHPRERRLLVRYEDFIADPAAVVTRILEAGGCADTAPPDFSALRVGAPLQGNRVTREETISLRTGSDPMGGRSPLTRVLQAPMMALLGRLRPATGSGRRDRAREPETALA